MSETEKILKEMKELAARIRTIKDPVANPSGSENFGGGRQHPYGKAGQNRRALKEDNYSGGVANSGGYAKRGGCKFRANSSNTSEIGFWALLADHYVFVVAIFVALWIGANIGWLFSKFLPLSQ